MTQDVSELMDGELQGPGADRAIRRCCAETDSREDWRAYHVIREAMQEGSVAGSVATRRILEAIRAEPTVLAPRRVAAGALRVAFAAAASVVTVAVVAWIGWQGEWSAPAPLASTQGAAATVVPALVPASEAVPGIQDYVVVHRQIPAADFYRAVSVTEPVR